MTVAGSDWKFDRGLQYLREARREFASGRFAFAAADPDAEHHVRRALDAFWSAMNWLEGFEGFEVAHAELHEAGRFARERFPAGCRPEARADGSFVQRCPVFLAHKRFGVSAGFTGNAVCSICGEDASECPHMPGRVYEVTASRREGRCVVCAETGCTSHAEGQVYEARASVIVTKADLREVSIVARPAQPDARIRDVEITPADIMEAFGGPLPVGARISCDKCLGPCEGLTYLTDLRSSAESP